MITHISPKIVRLLNFQNLKADKLLVSDW